jgi:Alpha/beta hydrolase of unknown function (DUF1400)
VLTRLVAGLCAGAAASAVCLPASAAVDNNLPVRWNSGGAVWSTNQNAFDGFIKSGEVTDRGLASGISLSGWTADELRTGMSKSYNVDLVGVSRFLYSDAGVKFLKNQSRSYFPYWTMSTFAVEGLRSAIIADAADGSISSAGIMANLPTDYRLADTCNTYDGKQNVCAEGKCTTEAQCTSLMSWYVFLPACIQANQVAEPVAVAPAAAAPVQQPIRGLW